MNLPLSLTNRVGFVEKLLFTKHLSVMIKSGIPLSDAIEAIRDQTPNAGLRNLLASLSTQVSNGKTFQQSLAQHPQVFDPFYQGLVKIGEESGTLETNLSYLAEQLYAEHEFRKKIQGAMLYPGIVLSASAVIGLGVSYFLLPKLAELFTSLDVELPLSTKILLFIADVVKKFGLFIPFLILGILFLAKFTVRIPKIKPHWHALLLRLPVLGSFFCTIELSNLFRNIGVMLKSGLPLTMVLEIQAQSTTNLVFRSYVESILDSVEHGKTIEQTLNTGNYRFIPKIASKMIGVGEKSGNLEESFNYLGDFFAEEVDSVAKNFSTVLEPILLLFIGLVVAFVGFAIITPLYQLTSGIRK